MNIVWFGEIERKLAKLSAYLYLLFFLLIILWGIHLKGGGPTIRYRKYIWFEKEEEAV
jgi:hypothetical protein